MPIMIQGGHIYLNWQVGMALFTRSEFTNFAKSEPDENVVGHIKAELTRMHKHLWHPSAR